MRFQVYCGGSNSGYTRFIVRLDNCSSIGDAAEHILRYSDAVAGNASTSSSSGIKSNPSASGNVIAVRADASYGSGHWYEGGGIYRPVALVSKPPLHFEFDSIVGTFVTDQAVEVVCTVVNDGSTAVTQKNGANLTAELFDRHGNSLGRTSVVLTDAIPANGGTVAASLVLRTSVAVRRWEPLVSPMMYTLVVNVTSAVSPPPPLPPPLHHGREGDDRSADDQHRSDAAGGLSSTTAMAGQRDTQSVSIGYRQLEWNASGLHVNNKRYAPVPTLQTLSNLKQCGPPAASLA